MFELEVDSGPPKAGEAHLRLDDPPALPEAQPMADVAAPEINSVSVRISLQSPAR